MATCTNCRTEVEALLSDLPSEWRKQIADAICRKLDEKYSLKCEDVKDCETLTSLSAFSVVGTTVSISYKDENGVTVTRSFDIEDVILSDITEQAQDAVGSILADSSTINFTYNDGAPSITAEVIAGSIQLTQLEDIASDRLIGRDTPGSGSSEELTATGGIEFTGSGGIQTSAFTGDVTKAAGGTVLTIQTNSITDAKLRDSAGFSVIGKSTTGTGDPADIIAGTDSVLSRSGSGDLLFGTIVTNQIGNDQVTYGKIQDVSATDRLLGRDTAGSGIIEELTVGGGVEFTGSGGIQSSAYTGDVTKAAGGTVTTIPNDTVTFAKIQNISTSRILGRTTAGSGDIEELTATSPLSLGSGALSLVGRTLIGVTRFSSSGTWTKPSGCNAVIVYCMGAGGGGGGALANAAELAVGAGGGAGAYTINFITTGLGATETVTVGAGGNGGSVTTTIPYQGEDGTASSFGAHASAAGGLGGPTMASGTAIASIVGGLGGGPSVIGATTIWSSSGETGSTGLRLSGSVSNQPVRGGSSLFGSWYNGGFTGKGAGGYGVSVVNGNSIGAEGGGGLVIVYEYS